jgi:hypothetical protein
MPPSPCFGSTTKAANFFVFIFSASADSSRNGISSVLLSMGPKPFFQNGSPMSERAPHVKP